MGIEDATPAEQLEDLDALFAYSQQLVAENDGRPVVATWTAPGVDPHEHDDLVAAAFAWLRRPEGPEGAGPR